MSVARVRPSLAPYGLLLPFAALFILFTLYPLARSLVLAFQQTFGPEATRFVGLASFAALVNDPLFWVAVRNTVLYTLGSVLIQLPLAMLLALALQAKGVRGRGFFRMLLFAPATVGVAYAAIMFGVMFEKQTGLINQLLHGLTGRGLDFPWQQEHVLWMLIVASLWMFTGFNMIFFSAALSNVREELVEASTLDGASAWQRFVHVIVPEIRPVAGFVVLMSIIGSLQLFELPYLILNNSGGPDNRGLTIITYLYQNGFENGDLGYASAVGWMLATVLILITAAQRALGNRAANRKVAA
jgi:ABC-type sugar transport system permease subunit